MRPSSLPRRALAVLALLAASLLPACTVTRVGPEHGPARIESNGLLEGHAAVGLRSEDDFFRLQLFEGTSDGALAEVSLWKLFRLEVGALGLGLGLGPFDLALGTLFYEPEVPSMGGGAEPVEAGAGAVEDCAICRAQAASGAP